MNKFPICLALKIPELWRLRRGVLTLYRLNDEQSDYLEIEASWAFPQMPVQQLPQLIERAQAIGQRAAVRELAEQVRQVMADRKDD